MQETEHPWRHLVCAALVFCAALALYAPSLSTSLIWDDGELIGNNPFTTRCENLRATINPENLIKVLPVPMSARPLVNASIIADTCAGSGPAGMKFTNLLLHAFNAAALFFLLLSLSGFEAGALLGALLFAVHPAAAETVHIITFRSHLLGFLFFNFGLLFALFFSRRPAAFTAAAAALCYLLALLSVETPIVLPLAAVLTVYFDSGREGLKKIAPLLAGLIGIGLFYLWFWAPRAGYDISGVTSSGIQGPSLIYPAGILPITHNSPLAATTMLVPWREIYLSPLANIFTMSRITLEYLATLASSLGLNADYSPEVIQHFRQGIGPLAAVAAVLAGSAWLYLKRNLAGLGMLLFFTALLPVLNIVPIYNIKAARYMYLPLAGFALAASGLLGAALRQRWFKNAALAASALWIGALAAETLRRNPEYKDNLSFYSAAIKRNPAIPRAQINLTRALLIADNCGTAIVHARQAADLDTGNPALRLRLAFALAYCGNRKEALQEATATLKAFPGNSSALQMVKIIKEGRYPQSGH